MARRRFLLGLVGFPLEHSLSPRLHQAALEAASLLGEYRLYPVAPGPAKSVALAKLIGRLRRGDLHGLNVTIPHKRAILAELEELTPTAQAIGAVNTIICREGRLVGENTDAAGFIADMEAVSKRSLPAFPSDGGAIALVIGAGGAARAVVYALVQRGWRVVVTARRIEQAQEVQFAVNNVTGHSSVMETSSMGGDSPERVSVISEVEFLSGEWLYGTSGRPGTFHQVSLVVNATPVGMWPDVENSPWPVGVPFPEGAVIYDLVYNPAETALVREARRAGLPAANGLGMLVEQAALAFELWTGRPASRPAMRASVADFLTENSSVAASEQGER